MPIALAPGKNENSALKVKGSYWDRGRLARPRNISHTDKINPRRQNTLKLPSRNEIIIWS